MARFNEILVGRFNRALQKLTGIKGEAPAPQLSSEFIPVIPFFFGAENRYLDSWHRFGAFAVQAAVAAQFGIAELRNPTGSNVVAVIEKAYVIGKGADTPLLAVGPLATDQGALTTPARFDARGNPRPVCIFSQGTAAAAPAGPINIYAGNTTVTSNLDAQLTDYQEIQLLPGDAILWVSQLANTIFSAGFWFRERFLEESERT